MKKLKKNQQETEKQATAHKALTANEPQSDCTALALTANTLPKDYTPIADTLRRGKEQAKAINTPLLFLLGVKEEDLEKELHRERCLGHPICETDTDPKCYYLAADDKEFWDYIERLDVDQVSDTVIANAVDFWDEYKTQSISDKTLEEYYLRMEIDLLTEDEF